MKAVIINSLILCCLFTLLVAAKEHLRCGGPKVPASEDLLEALSEFSSSSTSSLMAEEAPLPMVYMPVVYHLFQSSSGTRGVVPISALEEQIRVLNQAFSGNYTTSASRRFDSNFRFFLQGVNIQNNSNFYDNCRSDWVENRFKKMFAVDTASVINVYICKLPDLLGEAVFPTKRLKINSTDYGVLMSARAFPRVPGYEPMGRFQLGKTLVHELGHFFGLFHTFEGGCSSPGDRIADTPAESYPHYGACRRSRNTCASPGNDPIENYMDYSNDPCLVEFTRLQTRAMHTLTARFRPILYNMTTPRRCMTNGLKGNATLYSLCETPCYKNVNYPNNEKPSKNGFCYTKFGIKKAWGECDECKGVMFN